MTRAERLPQILLLVLVVTCAAAANLPEYRLLFVLTTITAVGTLYLCSLSYWPTKWQLIAGAVVLRLLFLPLGPSLSDDSFRYLWDGAVTLDGKSPYEATPAGNEGINDETLQVLLDEMNSRDFYSVYPPTSQIVFAGSVGLARGLFGDSWKASYYTLKVFLILLDLAAIAILLGLARPRFVMLYAWNPVVAIETAGQPHTETILVLLLVGLLWLVRSDRKVGGRGALLAAATWTKLYPILFLPLWWKRINVRFAMEFIFCTLLLWIPFYAAGIFSNIAESLRLYTGYYEFNAGLYYLLKQFGWMLFHSDVSKQLGPLLQLVFLISLPAIWWKAHRSKWRFADGMVMIITVYLVLATTVHPWYLLPILALLPLTSPSFPKHAYLWLTTFSVGTYLLYVEQSYFLWVVVAWAGFVGLVLLENKRVNRALLKKRSKQKADRLINHLPVRENAKLLDIGCAEGFVGQEIAMRLEIHVELVDVIDMNQTSLPHKTYAGDVLPFDDEAFTDSLLYFVLHHSQNPRNVLAEAARVSSDQILVVESVYESIWDRWVLRAIDTVANRVRSFGLMTNQEEYLNHKTVEEWEAIFREMEGSRVEIETWGRFPHKQMMAKIQL